MKKGFTLIEMLVVIGIIVILVGASIGSFSQLTKRAQRARAQELVSNTATALNAYFQRTGKWPAALANEAAGGAGRLNKQVAVCLATGEHPLMSLTVTKEDVNGEKKRVLGGNDRFGIVSPWAQDVIKRLASGGGGSSTRVPSGGTIDDHILYYALDLTGEGFVNAHVGNDTVKVLANAAVWCAGQDGKLEDSYLQGLKKDDIYSWGRGQAELSK